MELTIEKTGIWDDILLTIKEQIDDHVFRTWFLPVRFVAIDHTLHRISLEAGDVHQNWLQKCYSNTIANAFTSHGIDGYDIEWLLPESGNAAEVQTADDLFFTPLAANDVIRPSSAASVNELDFFDDSLNPKYTFDKFVVGNSNQFAHAAALGAAEMPGTTYNPLFLYGGVGLGKTHLMHAVGHSIKQRNKHMRVAYITSERFMNELIYAIRYDKTQAFRERYRSIDVLLMDDVQFMAGKERTQEEFFHTFNTLHNNQKQIVISSDCPPREIPTLEERLHSRFEWGLIADIEPPDLETKIAILKRKAEHDGFDLPNDIALFIAGKISNVRELEGTLLRLVAIASLTKQPLSRSLAQEAMKTLIDSEASRNLSINKIAREVAAHYDMTIEQLKSKSNARAIALPRQVAMFLCKKMTRHSFPEIGREFGGKHHTTVMHSVDKIEKMYQSDRNFHRLVDDLKDRISN